MNETRYAHKRHAFIKIFGTITFAGLCMWALWSTGLAAVTAENTRSVAPIPDVPQAGRHTSHFTVQYVPEGDPTGDYTCHTWPANAAASYEAALDIWADLLVTPTIKIVIQACWSDLPGTQYYEMSPVWMERYGAPQTGQDSWYPAALANTLSGAPEPGVQFTVIYNRSTALDWHFDTDDGPLEANEYDFKTMALRQIVHGIGLQGLMLVENGQGKWRYTNDNPTVYDRFVVNASAEVLVLNYPNNPALLATHLQSSLYFNGYNANIANGEQFPKLYSPSVWEPGLSYRHLDTSFYGTTDEMLAPPRPGYAYHDVGPVTLGMMRDVGWGTTRNTPPVIANLPDYELPMNGSFASAVDLWPYASDLEVADDAELRFSIVEGSPLNPGVSIQDGHYLSITLQSGWLSTATVTVQVADPLDATDTDTFQITAFNSPPTLANIPDVVAPMSIPYTQVLDLRQYATDPEDHKRQLTFEIANVPVASAGITIVDGRFLEVQPVSGYTGQTSVEIRVTDSGGLTASDSFPVTVTNANVSPIIQIHNKRVFFQTSRTLDLYDLDWDGANDYARDPEGGSITITITNVPAAFAGVSMSANRYIHINPTGSLGTTTVDVQVKDAQDATATDSFTVQIWAYSTVHLPLIMRNYGTGGER